MEERAKGLGSSFESTMKEYLKQGQQKLRNDLAGTREAMGLIAGEKTRDFIQVTDKGLTKEERELLRRVILSSMAQAFSYGYGIGKVEGTTNKKVWL